MSHASFANPEIFDQAASWAAQLHDNSLNEVELDEEQRAELQRWLLCDPRHAAEFKAHNVLLAIATDPSSVPYSDLKADRISKLRITPRRPVRVWAVAAVLAVFAVGLVSWQWIRFHQARVVYATRTGESRTVAFEDGVVAYLNTRTRLQWVGGGDHERRAALLEGEAFFDVPPDVAHPFVLEVGAAEIRVLGTKFNVFRRTDGVVALTVVKGEVVVTLRDRNARSVGWSRELRENQELAFNDQGLVRDVKATRAIDAVSWRSGVIVFYGSMPVTDLFAELSRYTDKRIVIRDPRVAQLQVGGAFTVSNVRNALQRLCNVVSRLTVTETDDAFFIDYRDEPSDSR